MVSSQTTVPLPLQFAHQERKPINNSTATAIKPAHRRDATREHHNVDEHVPKNAAKNTVASNREALVSNAEPEQFPVAHKTTSPVKQKITIDTSESEHEHEVHDEGHVLKPWNQYTLKSRSPYLQFLIMRLANPKSPSEQIPYRVVLIDTLLSEMYQMSANAIWDEELEDKATKLLQRDFAFDYLRSIAWSETKYQRLFLGDNEDFHQLDLDAFDDAMTLPLSMGIVRDEDLDCDSLPEEDENVFLSTIDLENAAALFRSLTKK